MKRKFFVVLTVIVFMASITTSINAQKTHRQAINICAIAIPLMNFYVVNYEYLLQERHGLAVRIEYAPKLSGNNTDGVAWSGVFNYRWHITPELKNFFIGAYTRYRYVSGSGTASATKYDFKIPEMTLGLNGGYRWISKIGFNVVFSVGYGYSWGKDKLTPDNKDVINTFNDFKKANNAIKVMLDAPIYGELSFGYAF